MPLSLEDIKVIRDCEQKIFNLNYQIEEIERLLFYKDLLTIFVEGSGMIDYAKEKITCISIQQILSKEIIFLRSIVANEKMFINEIKNKKDG